MDSSGNNLEVKVVASNPCKRPAVQRTHPLPHSVSAVVSATCPPALHTHAIPTRITTNLNTAGHCRSHYTTLLQSINVATLLCGIPRMLSLYMAAFHATLHVWKLLPNSANADPEAVPSLARFLSESKLKTRCVEPF